MKNQKIEVRLITIPTDRMRKLRQELVDELTESIKQQGLLQPIVVYPGKRNKFTLIAGRHRLAAVHKLGQDKIDCCVMTGIDADQAKLDEIDENLIRAGLTPAERAVHLHARKQVYEKLHPETKPTKAGGPGRAKTRRQNGDDISERFTKETAQKTRKSERQIQREIERARAIPVIDEVAGTSLDKGDELDALARLPEDEQRKLIERAKAGEKVTAKPAAKRLKREKRHRKLIAKIKELPNKKYGVILADPGWKFVPFSEETGMDRAPENHYVTEDVSEIVKWPVQNIAADDCVLYLWATAPMAPEAFSVMAEWGFEYQSQFAWDKEIAGTGHWNRGEHELLLIGTRGKAVPPAQGDQFGSIIHERKREHSRKPDQAYTIIEAYHAGLPMIELNRRGAPRDGWDAWGNEVKVESDAEAESMAESDAEAAE
jgi:N6-adenosine-specific RNA methylase IME4